MRGLEDGLVRALAELPEQLALLGGLLVHPLRPLVCQLGATAVFSSGEGPADGSAAKLDYLTVSTYVRDAGKRMSN